jgi:hypothetical protein
MLFALPTHPQGLWLSVGNTKPLFTRVFSTDRMRSPCAPSHPPADTRAELDLPAQRRTSWRAPRTIGEPSQPRVSARWGQPVLRPAAAPVAGSG